MGGQGLGNILWVIYPALAFQDPTRPVLSPPPHRDTHTSIFLWSREAGQAQGFQSFSSISLWNLHFHPVPSFPSSLCCKGSSFPKPFFFFPIQGSRAGPALSRTEFLLMLLSKGTFLCVSPYWVSRKYKAKTADFDLL